jgi:hypothetical protein
MFRHILDWLLRARNPPALDARLTRIEEKLNAIDRKVDRQGDFASFVYLYSLGFAVAGIGAALLQAMPHQALSMIMGGLSLSGLTGVGFTLRGAYRWLRTRLWSQR